MTFHFDARAELDRIRNGGTAPPTPPIPPTEPGTECETVGTIGTLEAGPAEISALPDDLRDAFEERAAIREFDGGQPRAEAEAAAWAELGGRRDG